MKQYDRILTIQLCSTIRPRESFTPLMNFVRTVASGGEDVWKWRTTNKPSVYVFDAEAGLTKLSFIL